MSEDIYCGSTINFRYTQRPQKPQLPIIFLGVNNYLLGRPCAIFTIYDGPKYLFLFSIFHCKIFFYPDHGSLIAWSYIWVFVRMKSIKHHQKISFSVWLWSIKTIIFSHKCKDLNKLTKAFYVYESRNTDRLSRYLAS